MYRSALLTAAICAVVALVPASSALAQGGSDSNPGVPAGQIEFTQSTVQVTGSNAVPRFERAKQYLTTHSSHTIVTTMKSAGLKVVSEGGVAVPIPPNFKGALVADPNNFFLTPFAPCEGCAPGIGIPAR